MDGWIKISRGIANHWLWQDAQRLQWWLDLLLAANWEDGKLLVNGKLITLEKGQLVQSAVNLSVRWKVNRRTVAKFLGLLKDEGMIDVATMHNQITIITICNYERYQDKGSDELHSPVPIQMHSVVTNQAHSQVHSKQRRIKKNKEEERISLNRELQPMAAMDEEGAMSLTGNGREEEQRGEQQSTSEETADMLTIMHLMNGEPVKMSQAEAARKTKKEGSLNSKGRRIFEECYESMFQMAYYWTAKDAGQMTGLLKKIRFTLENAHFDATDERVCEGLRRLLMGITDRWICENYSVGTINSKYNEILTQINARRHGEERSNTAMAGQLMQELSASFD